jgi:hypothetical protein
MRSNPDYPSWNRPFMSQTLPPAQAFSLLTKMDDRDDDDDDFQDPISLTRSSLRKVANAQPLRPCNAARQKKKSSLIGSSGKENRELGQISNNPPQSSHALHQDLDSRISCFFPDRFDMKKESPSLPVVAEELDPSSRICRSFSEFPVSEAPGFACSSSEFDGNGENLGKFTPIGAERLGNREVKFKNPDEISVTPTKSKLVESGTNMHTGEVGENFEPGTQLNELMNLCAELESQQDFNLDREHGSVDCPLCGHDLSGLSELLRQLHTNNCLDRGDTCEVSLVNRTCK